MSPSRTKSVAERLRACGPWVQSAVAADAAAVRRGRRSRQGYALWSSTPARIQAPGAKGTDHRLHIAMDLVSLQFIEVLVSDVHTGETLKHFTLGAR